MEESLREEWDDLEKDYLKLETTNKTYIEKLEEAHKYQKECQKQLHHQRYRMQQMKKNPHYKNHLGKLKEKLVKRELMLREMEQLLPKENDAYLKIVLGGVNVSILNKEDSLKYKKEYEDFKLIFSVVAFCLSMVNLFVVHRAIERIYLFLLVWYYGTLTIRESILRINGSKIKGWWRLHHFLSMATAAILLIWPENETWILFRGQFITFNAYLSVVQYLQFRYQTGVLYRLKALGERHNMDITIEGFHSWMWRGLSFLFPFLFLIYFFQLYMAVNLHHFGRMDGATWHPRVLSVLFFVLAFGNLTTIVMIIPKKFNEANAKI